MSERNYGVHPFNSSMSWRENPHAAWPLPAERRRASIRRFRLYLCAYALVLVGLAVAYGTEILEMLK